MSARLALHWALVAGVAAVVSTAAAIPFTGQTARGIGVLAAGAVCLVGLSLAPATTTTRKEGRS